MMYGLLKNLRVTPEYAISGVQLNAVIWLAHRYTISRYWPYPFLTEVRVTRLGPEPFNFTVLGWSTFRGPEGNALEKEKHFATAACRELHQMRYMEKPPENIELARKRLIVCARVMAMLDNRDADPNLVRSITAMVP